MTIQKLFLTFFGTGENPKYAEYLTLGLALPIGAILLYAIGPETLSIIILAIGIVAVFEINKYENALLASDQEKSQADVIVIDKVTGLWLSLLIPYTTVLSLSYPYAQELALFFGLISFYLFDTWKPSTIGWIAKNVTGGLGKVGSSALAGFAAGFLTIVILMGIGKLF